MFALALACLVPATMLGAATAAADAPSGGVTIPAGAAPQMATPNNAMLGDIVTFTGTLKSAAGHTVVVERENRAGLWVQTATASAAADGTFTAHWRADHSGQFPLRAVPATEASATSTALTGDDGASPVTTLAAPPVSIFRPSIATWYGPGFFGRQTACGHTLTKHTLGVANRTLPCGTRVMIDWQDHLITVPVVDRGPYANHADWDLTQATARALTITGTETIGVISVPSKKAKRGSAGATTTTTSPSPAPAPAPTPSSTTTTPSSSPPPAAIAR